MTGAAALVIAVLLGWLIVAAFSKKRAKWYPFGGVFKRDRKTGAIVMALTLPTRKSTKRRKR
jgi:hypothetical protein